MLRARFLKGLLKLKPLFPRPGKRPFGESRRCGDLRADLGSKLWAGASGRVERLRQKESRGKWPPALALVVAADTGLTSGEGVMPAMIGATRLTAADLDTTKRRRC